MSLPIYASIQSKAQTLFGKEARVARLIPLAGLAAIMIAAVSFLPSKSKVAPLAEPLSDTIATIEAIDYEIIADLEDLLGSEESSGLEEPGSL